LRLITCIAHAHKFGSKYVCATKSLEGSLGCNPRRRQQTLEEERATGKMPGMRWLFFILFLPSNIRNP
jgi:hypothetical protein